jgi:uncharacterized Zn-binding protein involved in type VI secretion
MNRPAARISDGVAHPLPPVLTGGPGSSNVLIGGLSAWRGVPVAALNQARGTAINTSNASSTISSLINSSAGGADIHQCVTPEPPHGPGVVINGSSTVLINGLPACRMGDTIIEAFGPPNNIVSGCPTVKIGG